jgi:hypothetical protein
MFVFEKSIFLFPKAQREKAVIVRNLQNLFFIKIKGHAILYYRQQTQCYPRLLKSLFDSHSWPYYFRRRLSKRFFAPNRAKNAHWQAIQRFGHNTA